MTLLGHVASSDGPRSLRAPLYQESSGSTGHGALRNTTEAAAKTSNEGILPCGHPAQGVFTTRGVNCWAQLSCLSGSSASTLPLRPATAVLRGPSRAMCSAQRAACTHTPFRHGFADGLSSGSLSEQQKVKHNPAESRHRCANKATAEGEARQPTGGLGQRPKTLHAKKRLILTATSGAGDVRKSTAIARHGLWRARRCQRTAPAWDNWQQESLVWTRCLGLP